jgi:hypothetical protein
VPAKVLKRGECSDAELRKQVAELQIQLSDLQAKALGMELDLESWKQAVTKCERENARLRKRMHEGHLQREQHSAERKEEQATFTREKLMLTAAVRTHELEARSAAARAEQAENRLYAQTTLHRTTTHELRKLRQQLQTTTRALEEERASRADALASGPHCGHCGVDVVVGPGE